jgi:hypothetical protein
MSAQGYICGAISDRSVLRTRLVTEETLETNFLFVHADCVDAVTSILKSDVDDVALA